MFSRLLPELQSILLTSADMDSTPKTLWSQKRMLIAKMELMRKAKLAKCDTPSSSTADIAPPEPTASEAPDESSETTSECTTIEHEERVSRNHSISPSMYLLPHNY